MKGFRKISVLAAGVYFFVFAIFSAQVASAEPKVISYEYLEAKAKEIAKNNIVEPGYVKNVSLNNKNLCIHIIRYDMVSTKPLPKEAIGEVAYTHAQSLADSILNKIPDYDILWDMIIVDFEELGEVRFDKKNVQKNEYDFRYFPNQYSTSPLTPWFQLDKTSKTCYR